MKINKTLIKEISLAVLSFVIPFITLIILFAVNKIALNNYSNSTIMMMDMQSEYIAYMRDLRRILLSNGSLIYTNSKVFGGDYLSIFLFEGLYGSCLHYAEQLKNHRDKKKVKEDNKKICHFWAKFIMFATKENKLQS